MSIVLIFFFFQAEDGIRDGHVTGVQTCALPILTIAIDARNKRFIKDLNNKVNELLKEKIERNKKRGLKESNFKAMRSEERRVGKECRYRRGTEHERKKEKDRGVRIKAEEHKKAD